MPQILKANACERTSTVPSSWRGRSMISASFAIGICMSRSATGKGPCLSVHMDDCTSRWRVVMFEIEDEELRRQGREVLTVLVKGNGIEAS